MNREPSRRTLSHNHTHSLQPSFDTLSGSSTPELLDHNEQLSYSLNSLPSDSASFVQLSVPHSPQSRIDDEEDSSEVTLNRPIRPSDYLNSSSSSPPSRSPLIGPSPDLRFISAPNLAIVGLSSLPAPLNPDTDSHAHSSTHSPPLDSSSSIIECHGSPRSLSSWHPSDLPSHPGSSIGGGSQFGDRDMSDPEPEHELDEGERGPPTDGEASDWHGQRRRRAQRRQQPGSRELFTAITGHLVMPRLSMTASASGASSRAPSVHSNSSASLHKHPEGAPQRDRLRHSPHANPVLNGPRTRVLVVGDAAGAHGLGTLDASLAPFVDRVERASELVAEFKITEPATHHILLDHVAGPFSRLQRLLDDGVFEKQTTSTELADLGSLVDGWVEREAYVVALVEMQGFPAAPETLDFILALSRLVPTVPFISSTTAASSASDSYAVYTRQLVAKRVRHLGIPRPFQPWVLPERDECVRRTRRCCLDWLAVEAAARAAQPPPPREDAEPDRWSEKVHARREALRRIGRAPAQPHTPAPSESERPYSLDPFGLPSFSCVFQLGIRQTRRTVSRLLDSIALRLLGVEKQPRLTISGQSEHSKDAKGQEEEEDATGLSSTSNQTNWVILAVATAATVVTVWGYGSWYYG